METKQEMSITVKRIEVNGTNLTYIEKGGGGEAVVFIHGAVSDYRTWAQQLDEFSAGYRAVSYSRRFHQPNEKALSDSVYSRASHAADLIEFLSALGLEKAHLVGHSYGASIALMAALERPRLVASLVLAEPSPFPDLLNEDGLRHLSAQKAGFDTAMRLARIGDKRAAVREFLHTVVGIDVLVLLPEARRAVVLENADTLPPMLRTYYDAPPLDREKLKSLNVPALLITGELSPRIARLSNEAINNCLPNSRIAVLKGASHGLQMENPKGFNQLVGDFLAENKISAPSGEKELLFEFV